MAFLERIKVIVGICTLYSWAMIGFIVLFDYFFVLIVHSQSNAQSKARLFVNKSKMVTGKLNSQQLTNYCEGKAEGASLQLQQ